MRLLAATAAAALGLAAASPALAETLRVPSETYPTIQSAVNAAADGDTVLVARGDYSEIVMVMDKTNLVIRGKAFPSINAPGFAFTVTGGSDVTITGFQITGGGGGVSATMASTVTISKVKVAAPTTTAFEFLQCAGAVLTRCEVVDAAANVVQDTTSTALVVSKCRFLNNAAGDVVRLSPNAGGANGSNGAIVSKNRIEGGTSGIRFGGQGMLVEKNFIVVSTNGLVTDGSTSLTGTVISKNRIQTSGGGDGIQVVGDGLTIERNTLTAGGLFVLGDDNAIDRNLIRASESYGINATGADLVLTRNRVLVASDHGMTIGGDGLLASGNRVVGVDGNGIVLNGGSPNAQLLGNRVTASDGYGIAVYDTPVVVTGNRASGNGLADYGDTNAEGVNMLTSNRFGTLEFNLAP